MVVAIFGGGEDGGMQVFLMLSLGDNLQAFFTEILEILTTLFCERASMFLSLGTHLHINRHAMLHGSANGSTDLLVWDSVDLFWFITDNSTKQLMAFSFSNTRLVNQI